MSLPTDRTILHPWPDADTCSIHVSLKTFFSSTSTTIPSNPTPPSSIQWRLELMRKKIHQCKSCCRKSKTSRQFADPSLWGRHVHDRSRAVLRFVFDTEIIWDRWKPSCSASQLALPGVAGAALCKENQRLGLNLDAPLLMHKCTESNKEENTSAAPSKSSNDTYIHTKAKDVFQSGRKCEHWPYCHIGGVIKPNRLDG